MKIKTGSDEFCIHCMEWQEYDNEGRCKICRHIIHRERVNAKKEGYNEMKSESNFEESNEENIEID